MKKLLLLLLPLFSVVIYCSCNKLDVSKSLNQNDNIKTLNEKFFNSNRTDNPVEQSLVNYLKKINNRQNFIEKTSNLIGYPRWDKTFFEQKNSNSSSAVSNVNGDSTTIYYIPFVRDSQDFVNASLIISASPSDTSFSYSMDWQYTQKQNSLTSITDSAEYYAIFFMFMNKQVFGNDEFLITDTNLFKTNDNTAVKVKLSDLTTNSNSSNLHVYSNFCQDVTLSYETCPVPENCNGPNNSCDLCWRCVSIYTYSYCWGEWIYIEDGGSGPGGSGGGGGGCGACNETNTPPNPCGGLPTVPFARGNTSNSNTNNINSPCNGGGGWTPLPNSDDPPNIDVFSSPNDPNYPDISDNEPQVSLQSLFNCFNQIPNNGATYSVKLCADLPVNGFANAPFNLTGKSPGHTFLILTKTNGTQSISQSVGFYPIGSGGNPLNPNATGGFKNNGFPNHEYNASINANNLTASNFSLIMNNLLAHENDTYNIYYNNCTTIALQAFNLILTPDLQIETFTVALPSSPPQNVYFLQSPQKLYKAIGSFVPSPGLTKTHNVNLSSPTSTNVCP